MLWQELGHTGRATDQLSFSFQNKPDVLERRQHNTFQQWEHLSSPFPSDERKGFI